MLFYSLFLYWSKERENEIWVLRILKQDLNIKKKDKKKYKRKFLFYSNNKMEFVKYK